MEEHGEQRIHDTLCTTIANVYIKMFCRSRHYKLGGSEGQLVRVLWPMCGCHERNYCLVFCGSLLDVRNQFAVLYTRVLLLVNEYRSDLFLTNGTKLAIIKKDYLCNIMPNRQCKKKKRVVFILSLYFTREMFFLAKLHISSFIPRFSPRDSYALAAGRYYQTVCLEHTLAATVMPDTK